MNKFVMIFISLYFLLLLLNPIDSTDKDFWHRSNMSLHIDNKTGCHYLSGWSGVLIPRINAKGEHICEGAEE